MMTMALAKVKPFAVEQWFDLYESKAKYNIAETCAASISLQGLQDLSGDQGHKFWDFSKPLTYGSIRGSAELRSNLASLYSSEIPSPIRIDNILITPGAIAANMISFYGLIGKGDHVICHYPTYQQLYEVPASIGAEVSLWRAQKDNQWQLDVSELKSLIKPHTKMIIINNPHNPSGAIIPKNALESIINIAAKHDLIVLSDEVYRPLFHSVSPVSPDFPPSILSFSYPKILVTGSLSKAYSLAGIRIGWIASRSPEVIAACFQARDYTTISVSQIDDQIATFALSPSCVHRLLARNIELAKTNLEILHSFVEQHRWACQWTRPVAGTTAFIKFSRNGKEINDVEFCEQIMDKAGVMFAPGSKCFGHGKDFKGYVRMGYVCQTQVLIEGLEEVRNFMKEHYENISLAD